MADPRSEFVEAMRAILKSARATEALAYVHGWRYSGPPNPARRAVIAFADSECRLFQEGYNAGLDSVSASEGYRDESDHPAEKHAICCTALLRDCGLEPEVRHE